MKKTHNGPIGIIIHIPFLNYQSLMNQSFSKFVITFGNVSNISKRKPKEKKSRFYHIPKPISYLLMQKLYGSFYGDRKWEKHVISLIGITFWSKTSLAFSYQKWSTLKKKQCAHGFKNNWYLLLIKVCLNSYLLFER